jgi:hypothetical protein
MSEEETESVAVVEPAAVSAEVKMEDGVVIISAKADLVQVVKDAAAKSDNTFDDMFVKMVEMARDNLDWKGYAKSVL